MADGQNDFATMFQQIAMSQLQQFAQGYGAIPGGAGNPMHAMDQQQRAAHMMAAQYGSTAGMEMDLLDIARGMHVMSGSTEPFDQEKAATQINKTVGLLKPLLPYAAQRYPGMFKALGRRSEQMLFAGDFMSATWDQGMTAPQVTEIGEALSHAMGPFGRGMSGWGLSDIGKFAQLGASEGWGPTDLSSEGVVNWARTQARGIAAIRDTMNIQDPVAASAMLDRMTMGGRGMTRPQQGMHVRQLHALGRMGHIGMGRLGGIQSVAGKYAQSVGGHVNFGREAAIHAAGLGAAMLKAGGMEENLNMANVTHEEFLQRDAMLTVNARMSHMGNDLAATLRLEDTFGFDENSQAAALAAAIKGGNSKYTWNGEEYDVHEGDWQSIMEAGGVDKGVATSARQSSAANRVYADKYNVASLAREAQWDLDVKKPLTDAIASEIRSAGGDRKQAGIVAETLREFQAKAGEKPLAATKRRREEVEQALINSGMNPEDAKAAAFKGIQAAEDMAEYWNYESMHELTQALNPSLMEQRVESDKQSVRDAKRDDSMSGFMKQGWVADGLNAVKRAGATGIGSVPALLKDALGMPIDDMIKKAAEAGTDVDVKKVIADTRGAAEAAAGRGDKPNITPKTAQDNETETKNQVTGDSRRVTIDNQMPIKVTVVQDVGENVPAAAAVPASGTP